VKGACCELTQLHGTQEAAQANSEQKHTLLPARVKKLLNYVHGRQLRKKRTSGADKIGAELGPCNLVEQFPRIAEYYFSNHSKKKKVLNLPA
jgi:hypothetical protein